MRTFAEIEREHESAIERLGFTPDRREPDDTPSGDGLHGRYCVVAVYPGDRRMVLSRWATSTMAAKIAGRVAAHGGAFHFVGVVDEAEPERGWLERFDDKGGEAK